MRSSALAVTTLILFVLATPLPAAADSDQACFQASNKSRGEEGIEVCTRFIKSGTAKGQVLARAFNNRGMSYVKAQNLDSALDDFNEALRINPRYSYALDNRGEIWRARGDFNRALADFDASIKADPTFTASYYNKGLTYERMGDLAKARTNYELALAQHPARAIDKWAQDLATSRLNAIKGR